MTNKQLILHIGAAKTGSSAIQRFLQRNQALLRESGIVIPDSDLGLGKRVTGNQVFKIEELIRQGKSELLSTLCSLVETSGNDTTVIVSAENLSNPGVHEHLAGIASAIPVRVVLYLRRQDDLLESAWQQWHSKANREFEAWLLDGLRTIGHWDRTTSDWAETVGRDNLAVRLFERSSLTDGDLFADFLDACGKKHLLHNVDRDGLEVNPTYSHVITDLVTGSSGIFEDPHDNEFYRLVGRVTGSRYSSGRKVSLLTPATRDAVTRYYEEPNESVRQRFFPDRPRLFSQVDHGQYEYIDRAEMDRRQMTFLAEMVYAAHRRLDDKQP